MFIQPVWLDPTMAGVGPNRYSYSNNDPINKMDPNGNFWGLAVKLVKVALKGGDISLTVAGIVQDAKVLMDSSASVSDRAIAAASLASEVISPITLRDAKAVKKAVEGKPSIPVGASSIPTVSRATNTGYVGPKVDPTPPKQADFPPGSTAGAARAWTKTGRIKDAQLPNSGRIRFVPNAKWNGSTPIARGPNNGYLDRYGNEWTKGPSRTPGQAFEWDVQLSNTGRQQIGWTTRDGSHANVSLDGRITHK